MAKKLNEYTRAIVNLNAHRTNEPPALGPVWLLQLAGAVGFYLAFL